MEVLTLCIPDVSVAIVSETIIFAVLSFPSFGKGSHYVLYFSISFERFYSCSKCEKILHKQLHKHTTGRLFYKF